MVSPVIDRRLALAGNTGAKAPVTVVATSNITLSGEQTVSGVALLATNAAGEPDRVLATAQTSSIDNGIWEVQTSSWTRAADANGVGDLIRGTQVRVARGVGAGTVWSLTSADPTVVGTSAQTWTQDATSSETSISYGPIVSIIDGVLTQHASLAAAVTDIGSTRCTVIVRDDVTMAANATFPATATLKPENRAQITTTGYTLTARIEAPPVQIFAGTGTVTLLDDSGPARPEWWGAVGDDSTDNTTAIQAAGNALSLSGVLEFGPGTFRLSTLAFTMTGGRLTQGLTIRGQGRNATVLKQTGSPTELIKFTSSSPTTAHAAAQIVLEELTLQGITGAPTAYGLTLESVSDFVLRNVTIEGFTRGVNISSALVGVIETSQVSNCTNGIYTRLNGTSAYCNAIAVRRTNVVGCSTFGFDIGAANLFIIDGCDVETCGTAADTATGAVMVRNTCDNETGFAQLHIVGGSWFEGNLGRGVQVESGMTNFLMSLKEGHILSQESGRALVIGGARHVAIENFHSPSTNDTWDITTEVLTISNAHCDILTDSGVTYPIYHGLKTGSADHVSGKASSFTATLTGCTTSPTGVVTWTKQGKTVTLNVPNITGTSNSTSATLTGMPAALYPSANRSIVGITVDNGTEKFSPITIGTSGTITLNNAFSGTFTGSGTKGVSALTFSYEI